MREALSRLLAELFQAPAALPVLERLQQAAAEGHTAIAVGAEEAAPLLASGLAERADCAEAEPAAPLVLDGNLLTTRRQWRHERDLARQLVARAAPLPLPAPIAAGDLDALFPPSPAARAVGGVDWQRRAAEVALAQGLVLITGGPGTGKTTVAARIIGLLSLADQRAGRPLPRVVLAAPTGKAAARLAEAVREELARAGWPLEAVGELGGWRSTLHRLLRDPRAPEAACAVIDEVSMADAALLDRALARLAPACRVLLLGDPDQLASVQPGRVLGDLAALPRAHRLAAVRVHLAVNWRAKDAPALAAAIARLQQGATDLSPLVDDAAPEGVSRRDLPGSPAALIAALQRDHAAWLASLREAADPAVFLARFAALRLISVLRHGPWGSEGLNLRWEQALGWTPQRPVHGRPLLITENRPELGLANGDLGVCWRTDEGWHCAVADADGLRRLPLARLAGVTQPAWFLSVHKAQGTQGERVEAIGLPPDASDGQRRLATREMVYTAITRARARVRVWWDEAGLAQALAQREGERRQSGFARQLARAS